MEKNKTDLLTKDFKAINITTVYMKCELNIATSRKMKLEDEVKKVKMEKDNLEKNLIELKKELVLLKKNLQKIVKMVL